MDTKGVRTNRAAVRIAFDSRPADEVPSAAAIGTTSGAQSFEVTPHLVLSLTVSQHCLENAILHEVAHESFDVPVIEKVILPGNEANYGRAILGAQRAGLSHARVSPGLVCSGSRPPAQPSWRCQVIIAML
jgi:hypothetical protein